MSRICQGVFAGGGVRGIGHVGAALAAEKAGYTFDSLAGSSAGAIVAALLAAGYTAGELHTEMLATDYLKFKQEDRLDRLSGIGKFLSVLINFGIYNADYFEQWIAALLQKKNVETFGDLPAADTDVPCRLQVTATDLLEKQILVLPRDLKLFGIDPMSYPIAKAVRMSMSIPIFYEPYLLRDSQGRAHYMVDGGLVSNYPIWILDNGRSRTPYPVFGFRFFSPKACKRPECQANANLVTYCKALVSTMLDGYDNRFAKEDSGDDRRSIWIPTEVRIGGEPKEISSTDFEITEEESDALFQNGCHAGQRFFSTWNFQTWKQVYRSG